MSAKIIYAKDLRLGNAFVSGNALFEVIENFLIKQQCVRELLSAKLKICAREQLLWNFYLMVNLPKQSSKLFT